MHDPQLLVIVGMVCLTAVLTSIFRGPKHPPSFDQGYLPRIIERLDALEARIASQSSDARLERLEQSVDAIAIEVERVAEGQRFVTKVLADRPADQRRLDGSNQLGRAGTPQ